MKTKLSLAIFTIFCIASLCGAGEPTKDDISIFAAQMIDSLRMRSHNTIDWLRPQYLSDSGNFEDLIHLLQLGETDYLDCLDDECELILTDSINLFEKKFNIRYVLFLHLLPPFYKANNPQDSLPLISYQSYLKQNVERFYIDSITGVEIGIFPQMQGPLLQLELFQTQVFWDTKNDEYTRIVYPLYSKEATSDEEFYKKKWMYHYNENTGWERVLGNEHDSVKRNDIVKLCVDAVKLSADVIRSVQYVDRIFIDHRYILQYVLCDEGYRVLTDPDYMIDSNGYDLVYLIFSEIPSRLSRYDGEYRSDIRNGAYFLLPKYRLDGDKFYVDVEVYFAKLDDEQSLTYDLLRTDTYTYQLDSENQWQLIN